MSPGIDAGQVIADLRELDRRTGGADGAQRLCWGEGWRAARAYLGELLSEIGVEPELDAAGNLWASLEGASEEEPPLALGSHLDSVSAGGWLDGALGVLAALGALRAWRQTDELPPRRLSLVDWADEEGARFGRSLFGSSAFSGSLRVDELRGLADSEGRALPDVLAENGVELDAVGTATANQSRVGAYLELHIEQGPVLEALAVPVAAVAGCVGIERHRLRFSGQTSHAGTTPMTERRDAGLAAASAALEIERLARESGGVATTGSVVLHPGVATAVPGEAELIVDLRHAEAGALRTMLAAVLTAAGDAAGARGCGFEATTVWAIEPIEFDQALVATATLAARQAGGTERAITSGALHDAAEVARVAPAAMLFCPSVGGLSHARDEDTGEADLALAIEAYGDTVQLILDG